MMLQNLSSVPITEWKALVKPSLQPLNNQPCPPDAHYLVQIVYNNPHKIFAKELYKNLYPEFLSYF